MSFRLVSKSVTLNDLERRNGPYFALFQRIRVASGVHCIKVHVRYLISDEFLFIYGLERLHSADDSRRMDDDRLVRYKCAARDPGHTSFLLHSALSSDVLLHVFRGKDVQTNRNKKAVLSQGTTARCGALVQKAFTQNLEMLRARVSSMSSVVQ